MLNVRHARLSLREAADVLRTDRRTRREEREAHVNEKAWLLHEYKHLVMKGEAQQLSPNAYKL